MGAELDASLDVVPLRYTTPVTFIVMLQQNLDLLNIISY